MAKSRSIGSTYVELMLKDVNFKKGLASAEKSLNSFASGVAGGAVGLAAAGVAALAAGIAAAGTALAVGTKRTLSQTDSLVDLANQTGVAVADMMLLQRAYADGGRAADMAGKDIGKMQKSLVTAQQGGDDPFKALGLSADELLKKNPAQQFREIGDAIMRISNPAQRTAKAMEIFGKGGMGLTTVFGTIDSVVKAMGKMPELAQQYGQRMGEANDLIGHIPLKMDQFFMGMTTTLVDEFLPALREMEEIDLTDAGKEFGILVIQTSAWVTSLKDAAKFLGDISLMAARMTLPWQMGEIAGRLLPQREGKGTALPTPDIVLDGIGNSHSLMPNADGMTDIMTPGARDGKLPGFLGKDYAQRARNIGTAIADMNHEIEVSQAKAKGNDELVKSLENEWEIRRKIADLINAGVDPAKARAMGADLSIANMTEVKKPEKRMDWERMNLADEYQSRGLSTTPGGVKVGDKMLTVMEAIHAILDRAELEGGLVWR